MADSNKFSMAHLALTILTTSLLVGGTMYSVSSRLIMSEVREELSVQAEYFRGRIDLANATLEARVDSKLGNTSAALAALEDAVYDIEKSVLTLQHQQIADIELRSMVSEVGAQLQLIRTELATLSVRTASVSELADKVGELNSQVILLNEKAKKK